MIHQQIREAWNTWKMRQDGSFDSLISEFERHGIFLVSESEIKEIATELKLTLDNYRKINPYGIGAIEIKMESAILRLEKSVSKK